MFTQPEFCLQTNFTQKIVKSVSLVQTFHRKRNGTVLALKPGNTGSKAISLLNHCFVISDIAY